MKKIEAEKLVNENKKKLMAIKLNKNISAGQKPHEKKLLKKEIARILTAKNK